MQHYWSPRRNWLVLLGEKDASVRVEKSPNGKFMWQFRKTVSYADTIEQAKEYVEAGVEFFHTMHRNPYGR